MLSDATIRALLAEGTIGIDPPPADAAIQPASVDLTLSDSFIYRTGHGDHVCRPADWGDDAVDLAPGRCLLASSREYLRLPAHIVARVEGKSTWGRRYLLVHLTAGFIDPGFHGQITLELLNLSPHTLRLPIGVPIAQLSFDYLDAPAQRPYGSPGLGSHYQGQTGATPPPEDPACAPRRH